MVSLKLLSIVDICLNQAKSETNNDTLILGSLVLIIIIRDFYQFLLVIRRYLLIHPITSEKIHGKKI